MKRNHPLVILLVVLPLVLQFSCFLTKETQAPPPPPPPFEPPFRVFSATDTVTVSKQGGVYYMLPRTRLEITIFLNRTEQIKGPFAAYAGKYLGIDNVIAGNTVTWQLDDIVIRPVPVPDAEQLYYVAFGSGDSASVPLSLQMNLNALGFLTGTSSGNSTEQVENSFIAPPKFNYSSVFKYYSENNLFEVVDTVVEKISVDSQSFEQTVLKKKMVEKPTEQKAKEAAEFIQKIKDQRISLLTGYQEIPYDPVTIRYMVEELEQMERDYLELFTGISYTTRYKRNFNHTPVKADDCLPVALARFSTQEGILPSESNKGETLYIQVCSQGASAPRGNMVFIPSDTVAPGFNQGFVYRIPEWSIISLYLGQKLQKELGLPVPQLGTTARLPYFITQFGIDPETGAIQYIKHP